MAHLSRQVNPTLQSILGSIKNRNALKKHILNTTGLKGGGTNYNIRNVSRIGNENGTGPKNIYLWSYNKPIPYGKNGYKPKTKTTKKQRLIAIQKRVLNSVRNFLTKPHRKIIGNLESFSVVTGARTISPRRAAMAAVFGNKNLMNRTYTVGTGRSKSKNKNRLRVGKQVVNAFNKAAARYLNNLAAQPR
jgi:hypothetical protein